MELCCRPDPLQTREQFRLRPHASPWLRISGHRRVRPGWGVCISPYGVHSPALSFPSHAFTSGLQPVGPAGERARGGVTRPLLAGGLRGAWRTRANASWSRCCSCERGWSAHGGAAGSRRGGPAGRGPEPGRAGARARAGAVMPLFFAALLALLLVTLFTLFLGR